MQATVNDVRTLDELRRFIHDTLCAKENLLAEQFSMSELPLRRRDQLCGLEFCLRGPRNVRLTAIWAADPNVVYLYDACGQRYSKLRLAHRPAFEACVPAA